MTTDFYVEKQTGTFADALTAFGLARLLRDLLFYQENNKAVSVRLRDDGAYYRLICASPLSAEFLSGFTRVLAPIPLIKKVPKQKKDEAKAEEEEDQEPLDLAAGTGYWVVDYAQEFDKFKRWQEYTKKASKDVPPDMRPEEPSRDWQIYQTVSDHNVIKSYNRAVGLWSKTHKVRGELLVILYRLFSRLPNDVAEAEESWKALAKQHNLQRESEPTALQLYNPDQGKGQNAPKANPKLKNLKNFWLLEFLRMVGLYEGGAQQDLKNSNDHKVYVLAPVDIDSAQSSQIVADFRRSFGYYGSITSDVMAILNYISTLIQYSQAHPDFAAFLFSKPSVRDVVAGFQTAFYKSMGQATTMMNLSFIGLPPWLSAHSEAEVQQLNGWLKELRQLANSLNESHSDAIGMLMELRDFLASGNLQHLFAFTAPYSGYYISQCENKKFAHQLSTTLLEEIVMSIQPQYATIFQSQGFRNIAYAIRQSTVNAQYAKARGERRYDIRYGLGQELVRKSRRPEEFLAALADFVTKYNAENAQIAERGIEPKRRSVATSDLEQVAALVDQYGAPLIANLLVAYGYASDRRAEEPTDAASGAEELAETASDAE
ncbi:MAG: hypothetical protein SNJ58_13185 [Aggregatilineales bacterium]